MIECAIVKDLLPLYVDDVLSNESKALVSEHLATCEKCNNEFLNMQSVIKAINSDNEAKIDVLKSVKKKFLKQKVLAVVITSVVSVAIAFGGVCCVFLNDRPIEYSQGFIRVERSETPFDDNGATTTQIDLNIISTIDFYGQNSLTRKINVNGAEIEVMYIHLTETLFTKWRSGESGNRSIRLAGAGDDMTVTRDDINYPSLPIEIYYMVASFHDMLTMSDEDFYAQRNNGVLLWGGTIAQ